MNQLKNRKTLTLMLCLVLVSVFTLTIAYSALSAVLTINGNARVSAADWDIYLNNPRVTNGSATTNVPEIKTSSTLEFETTLNMPGDFYEFVVDVVNAGDIDAMIENVVKTPDLTEEQAKFLKYEVSYQNGEAITTKQLLAKDTTMPIKVRVEYRKDLSNADLPTSQVVLDLSLTLEYIQSDGTGNNVKDNGVFVNPITIVSGNGLTSGNEVCIGTECFYVLYSDSNSVTMLTKYNLMVGNVLLGCDEDCSFEPWSNATGIQNELAIGMLNNLSTGYPWYGVTHFSDSFYWNNGGSYPRYVYDNNSHIYSYVENYKNHLNKSVEILDARLINLDDLTRFSCPDSGDCSDDTPTWIYSTSYYTGIAQGDSIIAVGIDGSIRSEYYLGNLNYGVRPVIVISKDYFN